MGVRYVRFPPLSLFWGLKGKRERTTVFWGVDLANAFLVRFSWSCRACGEKVTFILFVVKIRNISSDRGNDEDGVRGGMRIGRNSARAARRSLGLRTEVVARYVIQKWTDTRATFL